MSKILTFTNGLLTAISGSSLDNSLGARQYTFINGILTFVGQVIPGATRTDMIAQFINGLLVSMTPYSGSPLLSLSPSLSPSISPSASSSAPYFIDYYTFDTDTEGLEYIPGIAEVGTVSWSGTEGHNAVGSLHLAIDTVLPYPGFDTPGRIEFPDLIGKIINPLSESSTMSFWVKGNSDGYSEFWLIVETVEGSRLYIPSFSSYPAYSFDWTKIEINAWLGGVAETIETAFIQVSTEYYNLSPLHFDFWIDDIDFRGLNFV
jgi:hypothetical protein